MVGHFFSCSSSGHAHKRQGTSDVREDCEEFDVTAFTYQIYAMLKLLRVSCFCLMRLLAFNFAFSCDSQSFLPWEHMARLHVSKSWKKLSRHLLLMKSDVIISVCLSVSNPRIPSVEYPTSKWTAQKLWYINISKLNLKHTCQWFRKCYFLAKQREESGRERSWIFRIRSAVKKTTTHNCVPLIIRIKTSELLISFKLSPFIENSANAVHQAFQRFSIIF